jgi:hypothetical protein
MTTVITKVALCYYCDTNRVAMQYNYSCLDCTYVCGTCKQLTPYESGGADEFPNDCDECWNAKQEDLVI